MNKALKVFQLIFSIMGLVITTFAAGLALMVAYAPIGSEYELQVISAIIFLLQFPLAFIIFIVSLFKPKALVALIILPFTFNLSVYLDESTYGITPLTKNIANHDLKNKEFELPMEATIVEGLPIKRLRNYSFSCKHNYNMIEQKYFRKPPIQFFNKEPGKDPSPLKFLKIKKGERLKIIGAFKCEKSTYLTLKDSKGRLIEVNESLIRLSLK